MCGVCPVVSVAAVPSAATHSSNPPQSRGKINFLEFFLNNNINNISYKNTYASDTVTKIR